MSEDSRVTSGLATVMPHDVKIPTEPRAETVQAAVPSPSSGSTPEDVKAAARAALQRQAEQALVDERERKKREFMEKVAEARRPVVQVNVPQPVAPAILAQTAREMAEGARQNDIHAERTRAGPIPPRPDTQTTPVFRPDGHVPNFQQGQNGLPGNVKTL